MPAQTPEEVDALFGEYVNANNLDDLVALYEPTASLVQQDGSSASGTQAIREALAALLEMKPTLLMKVVRLSRAGDDLAVLYNDWELDAVGPDGAELHVTGKALEVVRRQADGTWRFAIDDPYARG
jgi:uncharacterized protein (TIGR02246 family)